MRAQPAQKEKQKLKAGSFQSAGQLKTTAESAQNQQQPEQNVPPPPADSSRPRKTLFNTMINTMPSQQARIHSLPRNQQLRAKRKIRLLPRGDVRFASSPQKARIGGGW